MQVDAFKPALAGTTVLSVTDSSQSLTLTTGSYLEIQNPSATVTIFVEQARNGTTATANTTTSYPILPGQSKIVRRHEGCTIMAYIGSAAGPTTAYVTTGEGV